MVCDDVGRYRDYSEHSCLGAKHGDFVSDAICDRVYVLGTPGQASDKLKEVEAIGVDQFNIYLMTRGQDETLAAYRKEICPQFTGA